MVDQGGLAREICQISVLYEKKYFCQYDVDVVEDIDKFEENKHADTADMSLLAFFSLSKSLKIL